MNVKFVCSTAGRQVTESGRGSARSVCFKEDTREMEIHSKYFEVRVLLSDTREMEIHSKYFEVRVLLSFN